MNRSDRQEPRYLKEIVEKYPNSDYAREARFLLNKIEKGEKIWPR